MLALGGGAVLDAGTRALLVEQPTVASGGGVLRGAPRRPRRPTSRAARQMRGRLMTLLAERGPLYAEVARVTIDTEGRTPAEVADLVVAELHLEEGPWSRASR
ncbi:MAG: shikimate kinase [Candidatus Nanopelagicales bacterium]